MNPEINIFGSYTHNNCEDTCKNIFIVDTKKEKNDRKIQKKEKTKRKITTTKKWTFNNDDYTFENQIRILKDSSIFIENPIENHFFDKSRENIKFFIQEIHKKMYGYKSQDSEKGIWDSIHFIQINNILEKLISSQLECFYCHQKVNILYEHVRDPRQWTLERFDNTIGHTTDNVTIACLSCNLRRRTIHYERYVLTKQLENIRKI